MPRYREEAITRIVDYSYDNPHMSYSEIVSIFSYPDKALTLRRWAEADPRYDPESPLRPVRTESSYTTEQRAKVVDYAISHPNENLSTIRDDFGYPKTVGVLSRWIREDPRYEGCGRQKTEHYPDEFRSRVTDYIFSHPEESLGGIAERFAYEYDRLSMGVVRDWAASDPRWMESGRAKPLYGQSEKKLAVDYVIEHPDVSLNEICKRLGYPSRKHVLSSWVKLDPRYDRYRHDRGIYTKDEQDRAVEFCSSHPHLTREECIEQLGYPSLPTLVLWLRNSPQRDVRERKYTNEEKKALIDYYFDHPEKSADDVIHLFGYASQNRLTAWAKQDPRWPRNGKPAVYTIEQKEAAVAWCEDHPHISYAKACKEIGYPADQETLSSWRKEKGCWRDGGDRKKYPKELISAAVDYLFENPDITTRQVCEDFGITSETTLLRWASKDKRYNSGARKNRTSHSFSDKVGFAKLVVECGADLMETCASIGIPRNYAVKLCERYKKGGPGALLSPGDVPAKSNRKKRKPRKPPAPPIGEEALRKRYEDEIAKKEEELEEAEFENDVLRGIIDILKKGVGLDVVDASRLASLSNREKTLIVNALRPKYPLKKLLARIDLGSSSYKYANKALQQPDKYLDLRLKVHEIFDASGHSYGYRRVHAQLKFPIDQEDADGIKGYGVRVSEKVVRKIMAEEGCAPLTAKVAKKYNSYRGPIGHIAPNLLNRDFYAPHPNQKLLTDITEFHLNGFKMYLSPLVDCYNGEVVSYAIGRSPNMSLVMNMAERYRAANPSLSEGDSAPIFHSDQGFHYQLPVYVNFLKMNGCRQSMSRKGCCSDNSACEGFFGKLKNEFFFAHDFTDYTPEAFATALSDWLEWHNYERIAGSLCNMTPVQFREAGMMRERTEIQMLRKDQRERREVEKAKRFKAA